MSAEISIISKFRDKAPCYLFSRATFESNVTDMHKAFTSRFGSRYAIGYSVKTNPHVAIVDCAIANACSAEVVSPCEFELVRGRTNNIIYNGIIPDTANKAIAATAGAIVNVENYVEFVAIAAYAKENGTVVNVGLRVKCESGSRFGIDAYSDEWNAVAKMCAENEHINIVGFHIHPSESIGRRIDEYGKKANALCRLAKAHDVKFIDFGGHMYSRMDSRLASQFGGNVPGFDDYAECIKASLDKHYGAETLPTVIVEPGTALVSNAVDVLAKVINRREATDYVEVVVNISKKNLGFLPMTKSVPVDLIASRPDGPARRTVIFGNSCLGDDVIVKGEYSDINVGDYLCFRNVGAYSYALASDFITPRLDVITI